MSLVVGQELWFVRMANLHHHPNDREFPVTVTKVGRKWAELSSHGRVDKTTMWVDGHGYTSSPGRCWSSKEAWEHERGRCLAWRRLQQVMRESSGTPPDSVSMVAITQAIALVTP